MLESFRGLRKFLCRSVPLEPQPFYLVIAPRRQNHKAYFPISKSESFEFVSIFGFRAWNLQIESLAPFAPLREQLFTIGCG